MSSDIQSTFINAAVASATAVSTAAAVGNNAALTLTTSPYVPDFPRKITITSAGDDSGISFTVVGTDVDGDSQTESITGANAGTATGAVYFLTIASITAVGDPAGNASAGVNASAADVIFAGRSRLKGIYLTSTATAGTTNFLEDSPTGTSLMKLSSVASATATRDVVIPDEGVLFVDGIYIQYTVSTFLTMTVFHA